MSDTEFLVMVLGGIGLGCLLAYVFWSIGYEHGFDDANRLYNRAVDELKNIL